MTGLHWADWLFEQESRSERQRLGLLFSIVCRAACALMRKYLPSENPGGSG